MQELEKILEETEHLINMHYEDDSVKAAVLRNLRNIRKHMNDGAQQERFFTNDEYRILLSALRREDEVCRKVDQDCGDDHKLIRIMTSIRRKIRRIQYEKRWTTYNSNDGWIPCEERLPGTQKVLITDSEIVMCGYRRPDGTWKYGVEPEAVFSKLSSIGVIAWLPLPEPYRPEKGE